MDEGLNIRSLCSTSLEDGSVVKLTIEIWPVPAGFVSELDKFIVAAVNSYTTQRGLTSGDMTDFHTPGKPN